MITHYEIERLQNQAELDLEKKERIKRKMADMDLEMQDLAELEMKSPKELEMKSPKEIKTENPLTCLKEHWGVTVLREPIKLNKGGTMDDPLPKGTVLFYLVPQDPTVRDQKLLNLELSSLEARLKAMTEAVREIKGSL